MATSPASPPETRVLSPSGAAPRLSASAAAVRAMRWSDPTCPGFADVTNDVYAAAVFKQL